MLNKLTRICPNPNNNSRCLGHIKYKNKKLLDNANNKKSVCNSCASFGIKNGMYNKTHSEDAKIKISNNHHNVSGKNNPMFGKKHSIKTKNKISQTKTGVTPNRIYRGVNGPFYGRKHSEETKKKMSETAKKQIQNKQRKHFKPNYNKDTITIIEWINNQYNINLQHAENGGEVQIGPYWVDAYDKEQNVVIEFYEPFHKNNIEYDEQRKEYIIDKLKCKFLEVWIHNERRIRL